MLMRYGSLLLGRELLWTGVLISWLSFFGALIYLYRFARERFGADAAQAAAAFLACYPFALYFSTAYTESLFLLTVVGACYHFERNELWAAGFWGLLAGLARPNGCLLSVVLVLIALRPSFTGPMTFNTLVPATTSALRNISWARVADRIAVAALPGIGMLAYSTFIYFLTGNPLRWASQNAAWGRVYRGLDLLFAEQAQIIGDHGIYSYASTRTVDSLHLMALVFVVATLWPVGRRLGLPYAVMLAVNVVPPLLMGGLISIGRVTAVLFPAFVWLGFRDSPLPPRGMDCRFRDAPGGVRGGVFYLETALLRTRALRARAGRARLRLARRTARLHSRQDSSLRLEQERGKPGGTNVPPPAANEVRGRAREPDGERVLLGAKPASPLYWPHAPCRRRSIALVGHRPSWPFLRPRFLRRPLSRACRRVLRRRARRRKRRFSPDELTRSSGWLPHIPGTKRSSCFAPRLSSRVVTTPPRKSC